jgi:cobalt/nickel transport system permease protein
VHIPDGYVDLPTSAAAAGLAVGAVAVAAKRASRALAERATTLPAVLAAYLLVAELLVVPLGLGTSAHLVGTGLAALLVGPAVAILCVAVVVVIQALLLADGGVTALGLNLLNNGVVPALLTWALFGVLWTAVGRRRRWLPAAAGVAAGLGALGAAAAAALELAVGGSDVVPATTVASVLGATHLVVAVVEGFLTAGIVAAVVRLRPDLLRAARPRPATATTQRAGTSGDGGRATPAGATGGATGSADDAVGSSRSGR